MARRQEDGEESDSHQDRNESDSNDDDDEDGGEGMRAPQCLSSWML